MSIATAANWGSAFVLTLLFPVMMDGIGASATFAILAVLTVTAMIWTYRMVPETKEKSLEEVVAIFERRAAER
jgi:SP family arabinose:H+ symporter-like MFS transporter